LGSSTNDECQIDSISQTWGIISGGAPKDRAEKALEAVEKSLVDRHGSIIKLLTPPFDKGTLEPGYIKGYLPGVRENGGQYTHAATWVIIAQCILGQGGKAFDLLRMILPLNHCLTESGVERYQGEPYVLCGDVYGVEPHIGRSGWSWYTGSAGWMYTAGLRYILGLNVFDGFLRIDPCIPSSWKEYSFEVHVQNCQVQIQVKNPMHIERGVREVWVNSNSMSDKNIPLQPGETLVVEVIMGIE
jgi:cyclic beta-1,2-glucan synthetase